MGGALVATPLGAKIEINIFKIPTLEGLKNASNIYR